MARLNRKGAELSAPLFWIDHPCSPSHLLGVSEIRQSSCEKATRRQLPLLWGETPISDQSNTHWLFRSMTYRIFMKIEEYKTAIGDTPIELDSNTNHLIADGYQPFGNPYYIAT